LRADEFLSPEGALFLRLPASWQVEQDSEDGHFLFQSPRLASTVRVAETVPDPVPPLEALMHDLPGRFKSVPVHLRINGIPAVRLDRIHETPPDPSLALPAGSESGRPDAHGRKGGRRTYVREWIVSDGRTVVYVTQETPDDVGDSEDDEVDALVHGLELRGSPHPVIATLLERLNREEPLWEWRQSAPLYIHCPALGTSLSAEPLVRSVDASPAAWSVALEEHVRKIRNLSAFAQRVPAYERVRDALLPVLRPVTLAEAGGVSGSGFLRREWAPEVFVYFAVDVPGTFHFLPAECVEAWSRSLEDVEAQACANLASRLAREGSRFSEAEGPLLVLEDGEGLAASRLLLPRVRRMLAERLGSPFRVAMPSAGVLIAFARGAEAWKEALGEDVWDAYLAEPVAISGSTFELGPDGAICSQTLPLS